MTLSSSPLTLRPIDPDAGGAVAPLALGEIAGSTLIGRADDAGWKVADPAVSRRHARIRVRGQTAFIQDLGSRHGTFVNGSRLDPDEEVEIRQGDVLAFGTWRCMLAGQRSATLMHTVTDSDARVQRLEQHALSGLAQMKLDKLLAAARSFSVTTSRAQVAEVMVSAVRDLRGCKRAFVVRQIGEGEFDVIASSNAPGEPTLSQTLITEAATGKVSQLLAGAAPDTRSHSLIELDIQTALCAPVAAAGQIDCYLYIDSRAGEDRIERDTASFCQALVGIAGLAIERILSAEMEDRRRQLDQDLRAARNAQELLFPPRSGRAEGIEYVFESIPGRHVGGDLFDFFTTATGKAAFFLGDATGKGVGAGMQMVATQTQLRTLLSRGVDLADAINETNESLLRRSDTGKFVTLVAGLWDARTRTLDLCDAGHGYLILRKPQGPPERFDVDGSVPLGVQTDAQHRSITLELDPGSRLILVSDGVIEQVNGSGEQFGLDRVRATLAPATTTATEVSSLVEAVRLFAEGPLADDLSAASLQLG